MGNLLFDYEETRLPNGIRLISLQDVNLPFQRLDFIFPTGANADGDKPGIRHMVEHLVSENVESKTSADIDKYFKRHGGYAYLGETGYLYTYFGFKSPANPRVMQKALKLFCSMLFKVRFLRKFHTERGAIFGEFREDYNYDVQHHVLALGRQELFGTHPLAGYTDPLGYPESIGRITPKDLAEHYSQYFVPQQLTVLATGFYSQHLLREFLGDALAIPCAWSEKRVPALPVLDMPAQPNRTVVDIDPATAGFGSPHQGYIRISARLPGKTSPHLVEMLAAMVDVMVGEELRGKHGWTYSWSVTPFYLKSAWLLELETTVNAEAWGEATAVIWDTLGRLSESKQLFWETKRHLVESQKLLTADQAHDQMLDSLCLYSSIDFAQKKQSQLARLHFPQLLTLMPHLWREHCVTLLRPPVRKAAA